MPSVEWSYDTSTSRTLRIVSHLPAAGIGGAGLLVLGAVVVGVAANPSVLSTRNVLLFVLLLVVGGPISLAYLWPMLTDPDQRPSASEFAGAEGVPFSVRSVVVAAVSGVLGILALAVVGVPGGIIYWLVVGCVLSPILVALATTHGRVDDGTVTINRTTVPKARPSAVRSLRIGGFVVVYLSYLRGSGLSLPRLAVVPEPEADVVMAALSDGVETDREPEPPDRAVQAVIIGSGVLFVAVAAVAYDAIAEPAVGLYVAVTIGGLGALLCLLGVRGV